MSPLSALHRSKISAGVKRYHTRARKCLAKRVEKKKKRAAKRANPHTKAVRVVPKTVRRVAPTLIRPRSHAAQSSVGHGLGGTSGQRTTLRRLNSLAKRVQTSTMQDSAPHLAF